MAKLRIGIFYGDKRNSGDYDNGVWMHLLGNIPFLSKVEDAGNYDVIIRTLWLESIGWSQEIRKRFPHVIQIGLSDHPLSTHVSKMTPNNQVAYLNDLTFLDGLMALTEEERQWYTLAVPNIPVIKAGLPFPFETYKERYVEYFGQNREYIGLGVGASDNDRNFISSAVVLNALRQTNPDEKGLFLSLPKEQIASTAVYADYFGGMWLHERVHMGGFYERLSQCKIIINLADRNTPGRIQGEAAFFGVPVVGSNRLELQNELWPKLAVSPYSVEEALGKVEFLLQNPEEAEKMAIYAKKKLENYNYRRSRSKFNTLLNSILEKRSV